MGPHTGFISGMHPGYCSIEESHHGTHTRYKSNDPENMVMVIVRRKRLLFSNLSWLGCDIYVI